MENENLLPEEEEINILSLTDEDGNEIELELIDSIDHQGKEYLVLLPLEEESNETIILEVEPNDDGTESFLSVSDEDVLDAVYTIFKERFADFFTFED